MSKCLACGQHPRATLPRFPALCLPCLDRAGENITAGARVICTVDHGCSGTVERVDDYFGIVRTHDGHAAWVPTCVLVRVTA